MNLRFLLPFLPFKICFNCHISTLGSTFVFWIGIVIIRERFACLAKLPSPNSLGKSEPSTLLSGDSCRTGGIQESTMSQTSLERQIYIKLPWLPELANESNEFFLSRSLCPANLLCNFSLRRQILLCHGI